MNLAIALGRHIIENSKPKYNTLGNNFSRRIILIFGEYLFF